MRASMVAFLGALIYQFQQLLPLLQEHIDDQNGEILPHVLMADITRWLISQQAMNTKTVQDILDAIEKTYNNSCNLINDLIVVSFLENLPKEGESGSEIRKLLGPGLKEQLPLLDGET